MLKRKILHTQAAIAVLVLSAAVACSEDGPPVPTGTAPSVSPGRDPNAQIVVLTCEASRITMSVKCVPPQLGGKAKGPSADIIYGGQNMFVKVTTSNVAYNSGTGQYTFDANIQNLLQQPIGTTDGTTLAPNGVRVFFASGPTVTGGSGLAALLPDGFGTFTAAGQPFYQYNNVLAQNATSPNKNWLFIISPTVETFAFILLISAPVQFPNGYIEINGQLPGSCFGNLHPGSTTPLTGVIKDHLGIVQAGTITWGTTDANQASVDAGGVVTGVRYGDPFITATTPGGQNGSMCFHITGTVRNWTGAVSTDWEVGGNWGGGYTPALVDTAHIPVVANLPALTANTNIGGVQVDDNARISGGAFNLNLSSLATTGQTAGGGVQHTSGATSLTGIDIWGGRFATTNVTGTYTLSATTTVLGMLDVTGSLLIDAQTLQVDGQ